nr:uncharacterized protein LOC123762800 isoform X1 [Procambarus clarkii]
MAPIQDQIIHPFKTLNAPLQVNGRFGRHDSCHFNFHLPISPKGLSLHDFFFEYMFETFDDAIREILRRWDERELLTDTWYDRGFRVSTFNIASRYWRLHPATFFNGTDCKIPFKIYDNTSDGAIAARIISGREVFMEDYLKSSRRFPRRSFPSDDVDTRSVSSVMPSDGVLANAGPMKRQEEDEVDIGDVKSEEETLGCGPGLTDRPEGIPETVSMTREASPSLSMQSAESCDSLVGRLWTFSSP